MIQIKKWCVKSFFWNLSRPHDPTEPHTSLEAPLQSSRPSVMFKPKLAGRAQSAAELLKYDPD